MATSYDQFFAGLRIASYTFDLQENRRTSETGGGELLVSDLGPRLWGGSLTVVPARHADQRAVSARVSLLRSGGGEFMMADPSAVLGWGFSDGDPYWEPTLHAWGGSTVVLKSRTRTLAPGQYFSFTYAGGKVGLHQVVAFNGGENIPGGTTGHWLETYTITPSIRAGAVAGTPVKIDVPVCKALIVPGTFRPAPYTPALAGGFSFDWRQTLR